MLATFDINGDLLLRVEKADAGYIRAATAFARHLKARGLLGTADLLETVGDAPEPPHPHFTGIITRKSDGAKIKYVDGHPVKMNEDEPSLKQFLATLDGQEVEIVGRDSKLGLAKVAAADGTEKVVPQNKLTDIQLDKQDSGIIQAGNKPGGNDEAEETPARVLFEVAPDPNDKELTAEWNALQDQRKLDISRRVADKIMPKVFALAGVKAEVTEQFGGWGDSTNPSFAAIVPNAYSAEQLMDVVKVAGFALSQQAMMAVRPTYFKGSKKVGFINIELPEDSDLAAVHGVYHKLREVLGDAVQGHTTVKGDMLIVDDGGKSEELAHKINEALGNKFHVKYHEGYRILPEKKDYDYASEQGTSALDAKRGDANRLRAEATQAIRDELDRAKGNPGTGDSSGPDAGGDRDSGGDKPGPGPASPRAPPAADLNAPITKDKTTSPPPFTEDKPLYDPDPTVDTTGDGISDASRVGVPAHAVPPPPAIGRLPRLTKSERLVESRFADKFQEDPDAMVADYDAKKNHQVGVDKHGNPVWEIGDAPNIFNTDDAKMLSDVYNPSPEEGISPDDVMALRSRYNTVLHQTANAIAKKSFLNYLDKLPDDKKSVLVTSGGVASGKGYSLGKVEAVNNVAKKAGAIWDAAGEQNATENAWILEECAKRGIKPTFLYVHSNPNETWENPKRGVVERAGKIGRMVDARLFAESYTLGAKNFATFHQANKDKAQFFVIDSTGAEPTEVPEVPKSALEIDTEALYQRSVGFLQQSSTVKPGVKRGGLNGLRIWPEKGAVNANESRDSQGEKGRDLLEEKAPHVLFTGDIVDVLGHKRRFFEGKPVKIEGDTAAKPEVGTVHYQGQPVHVIAQDPHSKRLKVKLASGEVLIARLQDVDFGAKPKRNPNQKIAAYREGANVVLDMPNGTRKVMSLARFEASRGSIENTYGSITVLNAPAPARAPLEPQPPPKPVLTPRNLRMLPSADNQAYVDPLELSEETLSRERWALANGRIPPRILHPDHQEELGKLREAAAKHFLPVEERARLAALQMAKHLQPGEAKRVVNRAYAISKAIEQGRGTKADHDELEKLKAEIGTGEFSAAYKALTMLPAISAKTRKPGHPWPHALAESVESGTGEGVDLLETSVGPDFTGVMKDSLGREFHFVHGKRVTWASGDPGVGEATAHPTQAVYHGQLVSVIGHDPRSGEVGLRMPDGEQEIAKVDDLDFGEGAVPPKQRMTAAQKDEAAPKQYDTTGYSDAMQHCYALADQNPPPHLDDADRASWLSLSSDMKKVIDDAHHLNDPYGRTPEAQALGTRFIFLRDQRNSLGTANLHAPKPAAEEPGAGPEEEEWDGTIDSNDVQSGDDYEDVADWSTWTTNRHGENVEVNHHVELALGQFTPPGRDEPIEVYMWQSSDGEGSYDDQGDWTEDRDAAEREGRRYARNHNEEEPEPEDDDEPGADSEEMQELFDDDGELGLHIETSGNEVTLSHPKIEDCDRTIFSDHIHNDILKLKKQYIGEGFGAFVFAAEVRGAVKRGLSYIDTYAARLDGVYNGYYTWLTLGYDESLDRMEDDSPDLVARMRDLFPDAETVQDVMHTDKVELGSEQIAEIKKKLTSLARYAETDRIRQSILKKAAKTEFNGSDWWLAHGEGLRHAVFDLKEGSASRKTLDAAMAKKKRK